MKPHYLMLAALLALPGIALAGEAGTVLKDDTLRKEPYADAASVASIKRGQSVDILTRKGAWLQIKSARSTGWVRLLSVRRGAAGSSNEAAGVLGLASGRTGTGHVVSTTGVRGLNEEDLKTAKFNAQEIEQMESYGISAKEGQSFAQAGGLKTRTLKYLPKPGSAK